MKKLMFTAAALCAAVCLADVESGVVGYTKTGLTRGEFNYRVATFLPTGDKDPSEMTLGDLQFENLSRSEIQILEDGGNTMVLDPDEYPLIALGEDEELIAVFTFIPAASAGEGGEGRYLSHDADLKYNMNSWIVPFGQQYVVDCGDKNMEVTDAGAVSSEDLEFDVERGTFNYFGNCSPVDITFGDLQFTNLSRSEIQILEDGGNTMVLDPDEYPLISLGEDEELIAVFTFIPAASAGEGGEGWYLSQDANLKYNMNDWVLESGAGFVIDCGDKNMTVIIPSAL